VFRGLWRPTLISNGASPALPAALRTLLSARGLVALFDFDWRAGLALSGGNVSAILSRTGGLIAVQASALRQPAWGAVSSTGRRGATFVAANTQRLMVSSASLSAFQGAAPCSFLGVLRRDADAVSDTWASLSTSTSNVSYISSGDQSVGRDRCQRRDAGSLQTAFSGAGVLANSIAYRRVNTFDGTNVRSWIDGAATIAATPLPASPATIDNMGLGAVERLGGVAAFPGNYTMWGVMVGNVAWTPAEVAQYTAAAAAYWG